MASEDSEAFRLFVQYCKTKVHFNAWDYDLRKPLKMEFESFEKRNDKRFFYHLNNYLKNPNVQDEYLVSAFLSNTNAWIGDLINSEMIDEHLSRMKRINSILHVFEKDSFKIQDFMEDEKKGIKEILTPKGTSPIIVSKIGLQQETVSILDRFFNFSRFTNDDPLWERQRIMFYKYSLLLDLSEVKNDIEIIIKSVLLAPGIN
jgi:hypothetical protein